MQVLNTGYQRAGYLSRVLVGGEALSFASWEVTETTDDYPTVNFNSFVVANGFSYDEGIHGPIAADVKFGGDWDANQNPIDDDPPGLFPRDDLADTQFYISRIDNTFWDFPYLRVRSTTNSTDVKGKVTFNVGAKNQGQYEIPVGSVS